MNNNNNNKILKNFRNAKTFLDNGIYKKYQFRWLYSVEDEINSFNGYEMFVVTNTENGKQFQLKLNYANYNYIVCAQYLIKALDEIIKK